MSLLRLVLFALPAACVGYIVGQVLVGAALGLMPPSLLAVPPPGVGLVSGLVGAYLGVSWLS